MLTLISCASISVKKGSEQTSTQMPQKIYVDLFNATLGEFNVDREDQELIEFKRNLQSITQKYLVHDLSRRLIPAVPMPAELSRKPENTWLIRGEFTKVNQGSRFLRVGFGFGGGGTKMETRISVYDLSRSADIPFLTFSTTGGSGAEPGLVTAIPFFPVTILDYLIQAALGGGSFAHGVTEDSARTGREVTAVLSDYMYRQGWIPEDKWIEPKRIDD